MRNVCFIACRELRFALKSWETYFWGFVMPVVFTYFIGTVTGQSGGGSGPAAKDPIALVAPESAGMLADRVGQRLEQNQFAVERRPSAAAAESYARRLIVPDRFTHSALGGGPAVLEFQRKEEGLAQDYDRFRVARAVYTVLADILVCARAGEEPGKEAFDRVDKMPRTLTVEVRPAGTRTKVPTGFEQAVPGMMIMFTMVVLLSHGSVSLVIERQQGRLKRLASTPISCGELAVGKWLGWMVIGAIQILVGMTAATVLFHMDWGPDLPMILLVLLSFSALCASTGMLLGNLVRTEGQAVAISVLAANVLATLGGLCWPIEITPGWMQKLAECLPTGWAMHAMHQLITFRAGASAALLPLIAVTVLAAAVGWLGARRSGIFSG